MIFGIDGIDLVVPGVERWDTVAEPLQQRVNERKIYEEVVNIIVDFVYKEFNNDEKARLRIYTLIADNFEGMVRALTPPSPQAPSMMEIIENGVEEDE